MSNLAAVLGTDHRYQIGGDERTDAQNRAFAELIHTLCQEHQVRLLAEEMSLDALEGRGRTESTVAGFARDLCIAHVYCDPSEAEQSAMGLYIERSENLLVHKKWSADKIAEGIAKEHGVRERFWMNRMIETNVWPCLLVCGSDHAHSICSLLHNAGLTVTLLAVRWDA